MSGAVAAGAPALAPVTTPSEAAPPHPPLAASQPPPGTAAGRDTAHWRQAVQTAGGAVLSRARELVVDAVGGVSATRRRLLTASAGMLAVLVSVILWLLIHTPAWYTPPRDADARHQAVRDRLERLSDDFSMALLKPDLFDVEISQDELNDGVALRRRIWPAAERLVPPQWGQPIIRFEPDRVFIAAPYRSAWGKPVIGVDLAVMLDKDQLVIRPIGLHVGSVPVPLSWLSHWTRGLKLADRANASGVEVSGSLAEGFRIPSRLTWWNGSRDFRIRDVRLNTGTIAFEIEPLGPRPRRLRAPLQ